MPTATYKIDGNVRRLKVPLKLSAVVTEMEEGGDLARALIAAIAVKKSEITEPLDSRLTEIPEKALKVNEVDAGEGNN